MDTLFKNLGFRPFLALCAISAVSYPLHASPSTHFIKNEGQHPNGVLFSTYPEGIYALKDGIIVDGIKVKFVGINGNTKILGENEQRAKFNYIKGNDSKKWKTGVSSYGRITYKNIYNGIDLTFTGLKGGKVEFQWVVKPYEDPKDINLNVECEGCIIENDGNGVIVKRDGKGVFKMDNLKAYQGSEEVKVGFVVDGKTVSYNVGKYDKGDVLIIDPDLSNLLASTFLGGSDAEETYYIYTDNMYVYVAGFTVSGDFPITSGAYDTTYNFQGDAFISKFDMDLTTLISSTFIGGSSNDYLRYAGVDGSGNIYITGYTLSSDYPTTPGVYDNTHNGDFDVFVSKLAPNLDSLISSTFIGGASYDYANALRIDASGNVIVVGRTLSPNYPTTPGTYDTDCGTDGLCNSKTDAFISKLDADLTSLLASTFLGGSDNDESFSIVSDNAGNIYTVGSTFSSDFPVSPGYGYWGGGDAFLSKFSPDLTSLTSSMYIGGTSLDQGFAIELDNYGYPIISGITESPDFHVTPNAYDTTFNGYRDVFLCRVSPGLDTLVSSTFLGGSDMDLVYTQSIFVDVYNYVYIAGATISPDFPTTPTAYDTSLNGTSFDAFVSKLNGDLSNLLASTYLGGYELDGEYSQIYLDSSGNVFISGLTGSTDFPTTPGAYDTTYNGFNDAFVSKFGNTFTIIRENKGSGGFSLGKNSLKFTLNKPSYVGVNVYGIDGRLIECITLGFLGVGVYEKPLNLPRSAYFLKVRIGEDVRGMKVIIQR